MEFDFSVEPLIPWPEPFDDGNIREFITEFEDIAEVNGVETEQAKLVILHSLLKGRAETILEAAEATNAKLKWPAAKEALLTGFDTPADRQAAMQRFTNATFGPGVDPLTLAVTLRKEIARARPDLDKAAAESMVIDRFVNAMPFQISIQLQLAAAVHHIKLEEMADTVRTLQYFEKENGLQQSVFSRIVEVTVSGAEGAADAVCQVFNAAPEPVEKGPPMASSDENEPMVTEEAPSVKEEEETKQQEREQDAEVKQGEAKEEKEAQETETDHEQQKEPEGEQEAKEEEEEQEEKGAQFYPGKEAEETQSLKIQEDFRPQKEAKEPGTRKRQEHIMSFEARRNWANQKRKKLYQLNHAILPSLEFGALLQKRIRFWKIYSSRKKKRRPRKKFKGGRSVVCGLISLSNQWKGVVDQ